jgi:O-antigen ligase
VPNSDLTLQPVQELRWMLLAQIAIIVAPTMGLVALGNPAMAARCFFGLLIMLLGIRIVRRDPAGCGALLIGVAPVLLLMRQVWLYSLPPLLFGMAVALWFAIKPEECAVLWRRRLLPVFFGLGFLYWWITLLRTRDYANNLRTFELVFSAALIVLLANRRSYLATAMAGVGISVMLVAAGLARHSGARLGQAEIGETSVGNPILLGLSSALVVLLSLADNGDGLTIGRGRLLRWPLMAIATVALVLSTSRGSWTVTLIGLTVMLAFTKRNRGRLIAALAAVGIVVVALVMSGVAQPAVEYFERATSSERTLAQKTTGRADQWEKFPAALGESPVWGHGPGSGASSYEALSGRLLAWHSLYLHVGAETGLIGLFCLMTILALLVHGGLTHVRLTGEIRPLVGAACFTFIGLSVSGFDAISGIYLGYAFLGMNFAGMWVVRQAWKGFVVPAAALPQDSKR